MRPSHKSTELAFGIETVKRCLGEPATARSIDEYFHCLRCGYDRPLRAGEDGFRIYILHEQRCNPTVGGQIWLPFITEDDLVLFPLDDETPARPGARRQPLACQLGKGCTQGAAAAHSRKAA